MKAFNFQKDIAKSIRIDVRNKKTFITHIQCGSGKMIILWLVFRIFRKHNFCVSVNPIVKSQWTKWLEMHPLSNVRINSLRNAHWVVDVGEEQIHFIKL